MNQYVSNNINNMNVNNNNIINSNLNNNNNNSNNNNIMNNPNQGNFIMGKIGNKEIIREDIKSFMKSSKELDWTTNPIYRGATNAIVKPTFSLNKKEDENIMTKYSDNVLGNFIVNDQGLMDSYYNFCQTYENNNMKVFDKIEANKYKICSLGELQCNSNIKEDIINSLSNNWKKAVLNSNELTNIMIPYKAYLNNLDYS